MKPNRDQRSYADQASIVVATALREKHCFHERKCRCFGRHRISSWLTLDALIHQGWTLTPPSGKEAQPLMCCSMDHIEDVPAYYLGVYEDDQREWPNTAYCKPCGDLVQKLGEYRVTKTFGKEASS